LIPDTYFVTGLVNILLIIAVLGFFFNTRGVSEEYFIRKNISNVFEKQFTIVEIDGDDKSLPLTPFSEVTSADTFKKFITETIPNTIFTADEGKSLAFTFQNPPIGQMDIRVQHWSKEQCGYNPIISPNLPSSCAFSQAGTSQQRTGYISLAGDKEVYWKTAEEHGIEVVLLDDDFSQAIDGSGFIYSVPFSKTPT